MASLPSRSVLSGVLSFREHNLIEGIPAAAGNPGYVKHQPDLDLSFQNVEEGAKKSLVVHPSTSNSLVAQERAKMIDKLPRYNLLQEQCLSPEGPERIGAYPVHRGDR